jgi:adenylate cyclase
MAALAADTREASFLPFLVVALGAAIFIFDTVSPLQFAVAVLYVVVVLIAATSYRRRVVLMTAGACLGLTILSYVVVHGFKIVGTAPLRCVMSLMAIGITTFLLLRNLSVTEHLKETERQRTNLARFFSPQRVEQLLAIDTPLSVARHQPAAVLFVDMIGSTAYFSRIAPDAVIEVLRDLHGLLSAAVFAHNGTIDKFLGDGLMAVFGAPEPSAVDATNAARCAFDIQQSLERWNERCERTGDAAIRVAVGIHYGDVVQGDIGSDRQLELTVIGNTVNIASRVEAYCRSLDASILATDSVVDALRAEGSDEVAARFRDEGPHALRGLSEPIHLYGVRRSPTLQLADPRQSTPVPNPLPRGHLEREPRAT